MAKFFLLAAAFVAISSGILSAQAYPSRLTPYSPQDTALANCQHENIALVRQMEAWRLLLRSVQAELQARSMNAEEVMDKYENQNTAQNNGHEEKEDEIRKSLEALGRESQMGRNLQSVQVSEAEKEQEVKEQKSDSEEDFQAVKNDFEDTLIAKLQKLSEYLSENN